MQDGIDGRLLLKSEAVVSQQGKFRPPPEAEASAWRILSAVDRHGLRTRWQAKAAELLVGSALATAARHLACWRLAVRCGRIQWQCALRLQARECAAPVRVAAMRSAPPRWRNAGWLLALLALLGVLALCGMPQEATGHACIRSNGHSKQPIPEENGGADES